jgi:hypothetical protein
MSSHVNDEHLLSDQKPPVNIIKSPIHNHNCHHMNNNRKDKRLEQSNRLILKLVVFFLIITTILITLFTFTLSSLLKLKYNHEMLEMDKQILRNRTTCISNACYNALNFMLDYIDPSKNACENFYEFSCNNINNKQDRNKKQQKDQFKIAHDRMYRDLADLLDEPHDLNETQIVKNFKTYYKSCTNKTHIEHETEKTFLDYMDKEFGAAWPMLLPVMNSSSNIEFEIEEHLAKLTILQMPLLFQFQSSDYAHKKILFNILLPSDICLQQKFLPNISQGIGTSDYKAFSKLVKNILESIGSNISESYDEQLYDMIHFANKLYLIDQTNSLCKPKQNRATNVTVVSVKDLYDKLDQKSSSFDFLNYIKYLNKHASSTNESFSPRLNQETRLVSFESNLNALSDIINGLNELKSKNETKFRRAFLNFVFFHSIKNLIKPLDPVDQNLIIFPLKYYTFFYEYTKLNNNNNMNKELDSLISKIGGFDDDEGATRCAWSSMFTFTRADSRELIEFQRLFLNRKMDTRSKKMIEKMLDELLNTSKFIVDRQSWIDRQTKRKIIENFYSTEYKIIHADFLFNETLLLNTKSYDSDYVYDLTDDYLTNFFKRRVFIFKKEFDLIEVDQLMRIKNKNYLFDIFLTNLMNLREYETMLVPAGILVEPIFNINNPSYLNYATVGAYMAHEIWHTAHDVLADAALTPNATRVKYEKKLDCLLENYRAYAASKNSGLKIDGSLSISEQISDTFAVLASLKTFLKEENYDKRLLPGLDFMNQKQLFMVRYAQAYCYQNDEQEQQQKQQQQSFYEQTHAVNGFRVFQLSILPEFETIFECFPNEKKNLKSRAKKCEIFEF